jgi:hypothetical protein
MPNKLIIKHLTADKKLATTPPFEPSDLTRILRQLRNAGCTRLTLLYVTPANPNHTTP